MTCQEREPSLQELVADLKHDLAKYVAFRSCNFDDEAWTGLLRPEFLEALRADLLGTLGGQPAWSIWDRHIARSARSLEEPRLQRVAQVVESLRGLEANLRNPELTGSLADARPTIRHAQATIRQELSALARELSRDDPCPRS